MPRAPNRYWQDTRVRKGGRCTAGKNSLPIGAINPTVTTRIADTLAENVHSVRTLLPTNERGFDCRGLSISLHTPHVVRLEDHGVDFARSNFLLNDFEDALSVLRLEALALRHVDGDQHLVDRPCGLRDDVLRKLLSAALGQSWPPRSGSA